jgi:hypothetical protein
MQLSRLRDITFFLCPRLAQHRPHRPVKHHSVCYVSGKTRLLAGIYSPPPAHPSQPRTITPPELRPNETPREKKSEMAVTGNAGAGRALGLLNGIPDRFQDFCKMDQITFVGLADWLVEHADRRDPIPKEITVEECMFVFLDIAAQGSSFRMASYNWDHDVKLTQL